MRYLVAVALILMSFGQAWTQSPSIIQEIGSTESEISDINSELPRVRTKLAELREMQRGREDEHARLKTQHDSIQQDFAQRAEEWNSACSGRMLYGGEYSSCLSKKQSLDSYKSATEPKLFQMEARAREMERQFQETANGIVLAEARIQKLTNYKSQLESRLAQLRQSLVSQCRGVSATANLEELKHKCGNIQFDGSRPSLPPCTTDKCKEADRIIK